MTMDWFSFLLGCITGGVVTAILAVLIFIYLEKDATRTIKQR